MKSQGSRVLFKGLSAAIMFVSLTLTVVVPGQLSRVVAKPAMPVITTTTPANPILAHQTEYQTTDALRVLLRQRLVDGGFLTSPTDVLLFLNVVDASPYVLVGYYVLRGGQNPDSFEPWLAIARYETDWTVRMAALDGDAFNEWLYQVPDDILSPASKAVYAYYMPTAATAAGVALLSYTGHYLPWQGGLSHQVTKWPASSLNAPRHSGIESGAWDWYMPIGTEVWASASGTVKWVYEASTNPSAGSFINQGNGWWCTAPNTQPNYAVVNNDDGTASLYLHLQYQGVVPSIGDRIERSGLVGYSGNTGYVCTTAPSSTSGAHLHFQVETQSTSAWYTQSGDVIFVDPGWNAAQSNPVSGNYRPTCDATSIPPGYTKCAEEGSGCNFTGLKTVYYGVNTCFRVQDYSGGVVCSNDNFLPDPDPGVHKACYINVPSCPQSGGVILYYHANYDCGGLGVNDGYVQQGTAAPQNLTGMLNDQASSVRVPTGWSVMLYENPNLSGGRVCYSSDISDFGPQGFFPGTSIPINHRVSSFEVFSNTTCGVPPPSPIFDAFPTTGQMPLDVTFHIVDMSNITNCTWNYGDGTSSGVCTAYHTHQYVSPGLYTVSLKVTGPGGSASMPRSNYISVRPVLNVSKAGFGSGKVSSNPAGIDCGATCSSAFDLGSKVTLTASANPGYAFAGWIGDCAQATPPMTCELTMTVAKSVTAKFYKAGDANGDGYIDGKDYFVWMKYYGQSVTAGPVVGDFDNTGLVDGRDYYVWMTNYGK